MIWKKNKYSLLDLLILLVIGGYLSSFHGDWFFIYVFCLFFLIPLGFQINSNRDNLSFLFRSVLLVIFPVIILFSFKELSNCANNWLLVEVFTIAIISLLLMTGKNICFTRSFKVYYIFILLVIFLQLVSNSRPSSLSASTSNSKIKATMSQMRSTAEMVSIRNGSYSELRSDSDFNSLLESVYGTQNKILPGRCVIDEMFNKVEENYSGKGLLINGNGTAWCYESDLINDSVPWCVDSSGYDGYVDEGGCSGDNYSCNSSN